MSVTSLHVTFLHVTLKPNTFLSTIYGATWQKCSPSTFTKRRLLSERRRGHPPLATDRWQIWGFPKRVGFPNKHWFSYVVFWRCHHLRKHPDSYAGTIILSQDSCYLRRSWEFSRPLDPHSAVCMMQLGLRFMACWKRRFPWNRARNYINGTKTWLVVGWIDWLIGWLVGGLVDLTFLGGA